MHTIILPKFHGNFSDFYRTPSLLEEVIDDNMGKRTINQYKSLCFIEFILINFKL